MHKVCAFLKNVLGTSHQLPIPILTQILTQHPIEFLYHRTIVSPIGSTAQHKTVISNAVVLLPKLAYRTIVVYIIIDGIFLMN